MLSVPGAQFRLAKERPQLFEHGPLLRADIGMTDVWLTPYSAIQKPLTHHDRAVSIILFLLMFLFVLDYI